VLSPRNLQLSITYMINNKLDKTIPSFIKNCNIEEFNRLLDEIVPLYEGDKKI